MGRAKRKRTDYGQGSVFWSPKQERWVVQVELERRGDGKRRRMRRQFRTEAEAQAFVSSATDHRSAGMQLDGRSLTVAQLLDAWLATLERRISAGDLAPSTAQAYGHAADHLSKGMGSALAADVSVEDVERFAQRQLELVSHAYVRKQLQVLNHAYRWAQTNRLLDWNPSALARRPRGTHVQGQSLDAAQVAKLLATTQGTRWHALWAVMVGSGLRPGEALALTWSSVQFDEPSVLHVRSYLRRGPDGPFLGEPKTARSRRSVDLPAFVTRALVDHRLWSDPNQGELLFRTASGGTLALGNIRRALASGCKQAKIPTVTPYDLRRTAGSLLVANGVHLEQVADLLGHSSVATTRRHYTVAVAPTVSHALALDAVIDATSTTDPTTS